jgi:zinc transport system substrate-binding protein
MHFRSFLQAVAAATLLLAGGPVFAEGKPVVYTVNYPLQYFAQRIAGDYADVTFPVPAGIDPAFWQPDAEAIAGFQAADLILLNGAGYAKWTSRASLPRRKLVDTSAGLRDKLIENTNRIAHSHGREGSHSHAGTAFTTWLDFSQAAAQVRTIRDALSRLHPDGTDTFTTNALALEQELLDLDTRLKAIVARNPGKPVIASHPVYQYFSRRYGINLRSVMWEPDVVPGEDKWLELEQLLREHPAHWFIWESRPAPASLERLQQLGIQSTIFDPSANVPESGTFADVMTENVKALDRIFRSPDTQ